MRSDEAVEGAFRAKDYGRRSGNLHSFNDNNGKDEGFSGKRKFLPCSYCQRTNHAEKDCWYKDKPLFHCNFCNKHGHSGKYCRVKKKQFQQPPPEERAKLNVEEEKHEEDEYLFMASQDLNSHELNTWLIDSGCTNHVTKYISIFTSIDKSIQPKIKLVNGNIVKAKGKGTIFYVNQERFNNY